MKKLSIVVLYLVGTAVMWLYSGASFFEVPALKVFTESGFMYAGLILMFVAFVLNYKWMVFGNMFLHALVFSGFYLVFIVLTVIQLYFIRLLPHSRSFFPGGS